MIATSRSFRPGAALAVGVAVLAALGSGCANRPAPTHTGFLSDYSKLEPLSDSRARYQSGRVRGGEYTSFIVDPVEARAPITKISAADRAEATNYMRAKIIDMLQRNGETVTDTPGVGVARIRLALTDVGKSQWWMKIHPVTRTAGAGTGGAAMEGEVIDSVTGEQLGAIVQAGVGDRFDLTAFSTLADVKNAIDKWVGYFEARLNDLNG